MKVYNQKAMRELKDKVQQQISNGITIDTEVTERYTGKVLFQHKIDRLNVVLKNVKLNPRQPT